MAQNLFGRRIGRRRLMTGALVGGAGLSAAYLLGSCGDDDDDDDGVDNESSTSTAVEPGEGEQRSGGTLRISTTEPGAGLDPITTEDANTQQLRNFAHNYLLRAAVGPDKDPGNNEIEPDLAESLPEMPDETTLVFKLRPGVNWQDVEPLNGRPMTAADIVYTYERAKAEPSIYADALEIIESIEAVDEETVRVQLSEPFVGALGLFFGVQGSIYQIVAPEVVESFGGLDRPESLIGTGAFLLDSARPGTEYVFARNPGYFKEGLPPLDELRIDTGSDPSRLQALVLSGELDILLNVSLDQVEALQGGVSDLVVDEFFARGGQQIQYAVNKEPLNNPDVRRAIQMSLNLDEWAQALYGGKGERDTPISKVSPDYAIDTPDIGPGADWFKYDPQEARRLLEAAGVAEGTELTLEISPERYGPLNQQEAELMVANLADVGLNLRLSPLDSTTFIQKVITDHNLESLILLRRTAWAGDPDDMLTRFFKSDASVNVGGWDDPELDSLLEAQRVEQDPDARRELIYDIQRLLLDKVYVSWTVATSQYDVWLPRVSGFRGHARVDNAWQAIEKTSVDG